MIFQLIKETLEHHEKQTVFDTMIETKPAKENSRKILQVSMLNIHEQ
jgi:hypothetical protein